MNTEELRGAFRRRYGGDCRVFFAPGRVNLIGEYTDFNGGHVLPCALSQGTYMAVRPRTDGQLNLFSLGYPDSGAAAASVSGLAYNESAAWRNYPLGALWALERRGCPICGADMLFAGDLPTCAGLSSSASIEVLTVFAFNTLCGPGLSLADMAFVGQEAENGFVGVNCGIMDQFAIAMGRRGKAVFLDTGTLEYEYVPTVPPGAAIMIMNTNKRRGLGESKYNERRRECEAALRDVSCAAPVAAWGAIDEAEFDRLKVNISSPTAMRRAQHAVSENTRTVRAAEALREGDAAALGRLMTESHASLRDDFEVTGFELDAIVSAALAQPGVYGARMTGAGFGGCAVALIDEARVDSFAKAVERAYAEKTGLCANVWRITAGDGPMEVIE